MSPIEAGDPFPCPRCGSAEAWKVDYYEAVWQTVTVKVGDDGKPVVDDYSGLTGSYDDGSTENELLTCRECGYDIELATFVIVSHGEKVLTDVDAVRILFGEGVDDPGAHWRSGSDIAASLAAFFGFTRDDYERLMAAGKVGV